MWRERPRWTLRRHNHGLLFWTTIIVIVLAIITFLNEQMKSPIWFPLFTKIFTPCIRCFTLQTHIYAYTITIIIPIINLLMNPTCKFSHFLTLHLKGLLIHLLFCTRHMRLYEIPFIIKHFIMHILIPCFTQMLIFLSCGWTLSFITIMPT